MNYKEACEHQVSMYGVRRIIDSFCIFVNASRDRGLISRETADRQLEAAVDVEIAFDDHAMNPETWAAFNKIRAFNRKHNLAA